MKKNYHLNLIIIMICFMAFRSDASNRPNIIFILADDLGWNDVGFHGSNQIPTPNIDALAYRGVIINKYYVQPMCSPSRGALMTGKYPIHLGMQHFVLLNSEPRGLPLSERLLPEYLKDLGYSTHAVGKWHLGFFKKECTPEYRGFDSHFGHWTNTHDYFDHTSEFEGVWGLDMHRGLEDAWDVHGRYTTELYTEEALKIIAAHKEKIETSRQENSNENLGNPLFLYLSHHAVHSGNYYKPLQAPDETVEKFSYIEDYQRRKYAAMVHWLDESVGQVVESLEANEMLNNSIIIFASDNGGPAAGVGNNAASNWPLRGAKFSLWEGGVRGVAMIWSPLLKKTGHVAEHLMHTVDWIPTLLSAVNGSGTLVPPGLDGFDQWRVLSEDDHSERREEVLLNIDSIENDAGLIVGDWKIKVGTFAIYGGKKDDWYGPSGLDQKYKYDLNLILNSRVSNVMDSIGYCLSEGQILKLREQANVRCAMDHKMPLETVDHDTENNILGYPISCESQTQPCLFNLKYDPCEKRNLADLYPEVLTSLLNTLARFNDSALPPGNVPTVPSSNPALWGNVWTNYGDSDISRRKC